MGEILSMEGLDLLEGGGIGAQGSRIRKEAASRIRNSSQLTPGMGPQSPTPGPALDQRSELGSGLMLTSSGKKYSPTAFFTSTFHLSKQRTLSSHVNLNI
jgi:hypothetical protein